MAVAEAVPTVSELRRFRPYTSTAAKMFDLLTALKNAANALIDAKESVRAATTGAITLSAPQTIDGVAVIAGNRVLVKNQGTASQNGIYVAAAAAWARSEDLVVGSSAAGVYTFVEEGTINAEKGFICTADADAAVVGTNDLGFVEFSVGAIDAGDGLTKTGNIIDVVLGAAGGLVINANDMTADHGVAGSMTAVTKAAASAGVATPVARIDHKHDVTTAIVGTVAIGDAAAEGAATSLARSDHTHAVTAPAAPADVTKAAAAAGASTNVARADHKHDISTAVVGAIAPDDIAAEGVATSLARSDHTHGVVAAVAGAILVGDAAAEGAATSFARSDHTHSLAAPAAPADVTKAAADAGVGTTAARVDHKHDISTAVANAIQIGDAAAEGVATSLARSDHAHSVAAPAAPADVGTVAGAGAMTAASRADHVHDLPETVLRAVAAELTAGLAVNGQKVTGMGAPGDPADATTKQYVDNLLNGIAWKESVRLATVAPLAAYTRLVNVITAVGNGAMANIDGTAVAITNRILLKNGAVGQDNGLFAITQVGDGGNPFILTRTTDADTSAEVNSDLAVFVEEGVTLADTGWTLTTNDPITLNITPLAFTQFTGLGSVTAGDGLTKTGDTIDVVTADDSMTVNANSIQVKVNAVGGLAVTGAGIGLTGTTGSDNAVVTIGGTTDSTAPVITVGGSTDSTVPVIAVGGSTDSGNAVIGGSAAATVAVNQVTNTTGLTAQSYAAPDAQYTQFDIGRSDGKSYYYKSGTQWGGCTFHAKAAGEAGNAYTIQVVGDSAPAGGVTIDEGTNAILIHYESGVSTVGDVQTALIPTVKISCANGVPLNILTAAPDDWGPVPMDGGMDGLEFLTATYTPDYPRNLYVYFGSLWDAGAGNVTIHGTDWQDNVVNVVCLWPGWMGSTETDTCFKTVTSILKDGVGATTGPVTIQLSDKFAVTGGALLAAIGMVNVDGLLDTGVVWDATNVQRQGFTASGALKPDGARNFAALAPLTTSHAHTQDSHDHAFGTIADSGHTHGPTALTATDTGHIHGSTALTAAAPGHTHGPVLLTAIDSGHTHPKL